MNLRLSPRRAVPALVLLACAVGLLGVAGCKKPPSAKIVANTPSDWTAQTVPGQGVTFRAPPKWKTADDMHGTTYMMEVDGMGTNLNFVVQPKTSGMNIDDAPKQIPAALKTKLPTFKLVAAEIVDINGQRSSRITYEMSMSGIPMKATQYVLLSDKTACFVTFTAGAGNYDAHIKDAEQVAASVKLP